jgi:hypothetical protein
MKRLVLLALLLVPTTVCTLAKIEDRSGDVASPPAPVLAPTPPLPPAPPVPVAVEERAPEGDAPPPPWFRPAGDDEDSIRFRQGDPPARIWINGKPVPRVRRIRTADHPSHGIVDRLTPVPGELMATKERARQSARARLDKEIARWLAPTVPGGWKAPADRVDALVAAGQIEYAEVPKEYGTLYQATLHCDFSPARRAEFVQAYQDSVRARRLATLEVILGFVLACLAALAGYIRADEATKGYYTNRLRALTVATVGAAGFVAYRLLT